MCPPDVITKQRPPPGHEGTTAVPIPCIVFSISSIQRIAGTCVVCAGGEVGACGRAWAHAATARCVHPFNRCAHLVASRLPLATRRSLLIAQAGTH
ncbi:hypothetical protein EON66_00855 [archaeon]|nr:MAG: hypothetical protein EON66_00855 [archaeon]